MTLDLARWQFALTSINHFLFVPVTIGLAFLTALLQTSWHRSKDPGYLRLTRFFGTLLVINVAVGVVTGLVQEFEFGMNWSAYSRLVGDIFGAPLAMEGLAAFFLESTFLGLWLFGWGKLSRRVHLLCIWLVALGTVLSAAFIMAANSWMQHPVGYVINRRTGKPQLNDIWAVLTNPVFLWGYAHVLLASLVTGAAVMLAVSAWQLRHHPAAEGKAPAATGQMAATPAATMPAAASQTADSRAPAGQIPISHTAVFARSAQLSLVVLVPAIILAMFVGSELGVIEARYQPMKIAAAEAQWTTCQPCSFSLFQIGGGNNDHAPTQILAIPHLLSLLATNSWNGKVTGLSPLQSQYTRQFGPGYYVPDVFIQYWSMRIMAYTAGLDVPARALGAVAAPPPDAGPLPVVPHAGGLGGDPALPDEHRGLAAHRERTSAVDRPGHHAHEERRVAVRRAGQRHYQPDGFRCGVSKPHHRRRDADDPLRAEGSRAGTRRR